MTPATAQNPDYSVWSRMHNHKALSKQEIKKCLLIKHVDVVVSSQTMSNIDHRPNEQNVLHFETNFCQHSNFIKHDQTRCPNRKMFVHLTKFDP